MTDTTQAPPAGPGDNLPPAFEVLDDRAKALVAAANRWLTERKEITDEDTAGKCSDFIEQVNGHAKATETQRKTEKEPHVAAGKAVDAAYKPILERLAMIKAKLQPLLTAFLQAKARRQDEERRRLEAEAEAKRLEAERLAQEAEAGEGDVIGTAVAAEQAQAEAAEIAKAAEQAAGPARTKGDYGTRATGLRTRRWAVIADLDKALAYYRDRPDIADTVLKLANADIRGGRKAIPGIRIHSEQKAV